MLLLLCVRFQKCENWKWNFVMTVSGLENTKVKMKNFTTAWKLGTSVAGKNYAKLIDDSQMLHVISKAACFLVTYQRELFSWWLLYVVCGFINNKWYIFEFPNTWYFSIHGFTFPP